MIRFPMSRSRNLIRSSRSWPCLPLASLLVALAGCGHENQSNPPASAQSQAPSQQSTTAEQYGSALNQPGGTTQPQEMNPPPSQQEQQGTMSNPTEQQTPGAEQAPAAGTPSTTTTVDVSSLDDAQIAAVLDAINAGQIQQAKLAERSASMPQVQQYAKQLLLTHENMQSKLNALYERSQIRPSPNALSNQIQSDDLNEATSMQSLRGKDFDRTFLDHQVRAHNRTLELLDRSMPNAKDPLLKAELQEVRARVDAQLRAAELLQQQAQQGATNQQGAPPYRRGSMNVHPEGSPSQMR